MKRTILILALMMSVMLVPLFATGEKEAVTQEKQIRIAEQVPNLITPGVWDGQTFSLNSSIYEYLVEINPDTKELVPVLATSWSTTDGKRWEFKLRQGVTFQDGSAFDSADVKYTIERTQDETIGHLKKQDFAVVSSIETPDKFTVILNLKEARPTFIYLMTDYNMPMLSSDYDYANLGESKPMGTGPFILQQMIPKESAVLVKNANYWAPGLPKVDKLLIYFVPDIDASVSMLEAGKVDVVPFITPVIKQRLESIGGISVISPYQEHRFVAMAENMKPFDDNRVRLALKYAMDPQIIAKSVTQMDLGKGSNYNETPLLNTLSQYKEMPLRGQDIAKAKALLSEAGYPNGVTVELYFASDHPFGKELAQTIKELAAPAGFTINLKGYPRDVYLTQYWLNVPFCITGWGGRIDPSMLLAYAFKSTGPWNESHMNNAKVDELINKISAEVNDAKRNEYYHELQDIFYEEGTVLNVQVPYLVAISDKVVGYKQPLTMLPQYKYTDIK
ncbi:ABC-type dipeptide transport system, periplasmic component [Sphaerochaeta pleomorpha str. Grapes]|uniref:ABC-type dipeptide transport system, periplasmic component n=1 Tax=Sphaerochaeta pleomorpha (strain ATCC BAA-1885 / DSM 22778 / Grapes) TaxID=158190 RepID=G8QW52_SPHPG|nr:ABC transporter substrate-binding protein [Sphaerochaeta pleomorpha]AEV28295.1 ABC-type dipeptide transport system, periplasmic component [Sphaerochaeta pleomorpha str. Grapes]